MMVDRVHITAADTQTHGNVINKWINKYRDIDGIYEYIWDINLFRPNKSTHYRLHNRRIGIWCCVFMCTKSETISSQYFLWYFVSLMCCWKPSFVFIYLFFLWPNTNFLEKRFRFPIEILTVKPTFHTKPHDEYYVVYPSLHRDE